MASSKPTRDTPKTSQINIRFDPETDAELSAVAQSLGVSKSALVRRLTEKFLAEVRRTGAVSLNPKWLGEIGPADARSEWGERKIMKVAEDPAEYRVNATKGGKPTTK